MRRRARHDDVGADAAVTGKRQTFDQFLFADDLVGALGQRPVDALDAKWMREDHGFLARASRHSVSFARTSKMPCCESTSTAEAIVIHLEQRLRQNRRRTCCALQTKTKAA